MENSVTEYQILIHHAEEGGYWAEVPVLEGCFAQGETVEDVVADARRAISSHLTAMQEDSQSVSE